MEHAQTSEARVGQKECQTQAGVRHQNRPSYCIVVFVMMRSFPRLFLVTSVVDLVAVVC